MPSSNANSTVAASANAKNGVYVLGGGDNLAIEQSIKASFDAGIDLYKAGQSLPAGDSEEVKIQKLGWKFERRRELDYELQLATISESFQRLEINPRIRVWR